MARLSSSRVSGYTTLTVPGSAAVNTGSMRWTAPVACQIAGVSVSATVAPTGAALVVDVNKNGTTIYTTQANRPQIASGTNFASETAPDVTGLAAGDYLTIDVDQVGSTLPGTDLVVVIRLR